MEKIEKLALRVPEAAEALGVCRAQAYKMVNSGELPCIRVGRRLLVPLAKLKDWMAAQGNDVGVGEEADQR